VIRWDILNEALLYYQRLEFKYLEVPWAIPRRAMEITSPPGAAEYKIDDNLLVASAEQSLLHYAQLGELTTTRKYVALTPCFRGDNLDALHHRYFMKVELMHYRPTNPEQSAEFMLGSALEFFRKYIPCHPLKLPDGSVDIQTVDGIELGSYGIRNHPSVGTWVYGTGVAEPRLSYAMSLGKKLFKVPTK
jgi:seryl-tRNA synthetase